MKIKIDKFIVIALFLMLFSSCANKSVSSWTDNEENQVATGVGRYTVLVYMCGGSQEQDYSLGTESLKSIAGCEFVGNLNVLVQTGGSLSWKKTGMSATKTQRWKLTKNNLNIVEESELKNMADPNTLSNFITWGVNKYPADNYILMLWGNGGGWRGIGMDTAFNNDTLTLTKLKTGLENAFSVTNKKFEMLVFDANYMSNLETASVVAPYANYMSAFEDIMPGNDIGYSDFLNNIAINSDAKGDAIAKNIKEFSRRQAELSPDMYETNFSAIKLSQVDGLVTAMEELTDKIIEAGVLNNGFQLIRHSQLRTSAEVIGGRAVLNAYGLDMVDIGRFVENLRAYYPIEVNKIEEILKKAIVVSSSKNEEGPSVGISVYFPQKFTSNEVNNVEKHYENIPFSPKYKQFVKKYGEKANTLNYPFSFNGGEVKVGETTTTKLLSNNIWLVNDANSVLLQKLRGNEYLKIGINNAKIDQANDQITANNTLTWPMMDKIPLALYAVRKTPVYIEYAMPAIINGAKGDIFFRRRVGSNSLKLKNYTLWPEPSTGMSKNKLSVLKTGDMVMPLYEKITTATPNTPVLVDGRIFKYNEDMNVELRNMDGQGYFYAFGVDDFSGKSYYTNAITN